MQSNHSIIHNTELNGITADTIPTFSLLIEWENVHHAELSRAYKMLDQVSKQINELSKIISKPELIIVYNSEDVSKVVVERTLKERLSKCMNLVVLKIIPTDGLHYHDLKNFASKYSTREIVIFLDSDTIPEDFWLVNLLEPFQKNEIMVVGGHTYINQGSFYEKALSLFWFFPSESENLDHFCESELFYANNVAIRRKVFENFPFPHNPQFRGQCVELSNILWRNGIKIYRQSLARVNHPAPKFDRFFLQALCEGHDIAIVQSRNKKNKLRLSNDSKQSRKVLPSAFSRIGPRYRSGGFSKIDLFGSYGICSFYLGLRFLGLLISRIRPQLIRNHIQI